MKRRRDVKGASEVEERGGGNLFAPKKHSPVFTTAPACLQRFPCKARLSGGTLIRRRLHQARWMKSWPAA